MQSSMCLCFFLECGIEGQEMDIFQYLFPDHPLLCVCICWSCWIPQNGATPLHMSAQNGHKEVVEVLLQNGAEVNATRKVICDQWRDMIQRNAYQSSRNDMQSAGMALTMADCIEPMVQGWGGWWGFIERVCTSMHIGDRMQIMGYIVWHAFLAAMWIRELPKKVICCWCTFSWRCLLLGIAHLHEWFLWVLRI